MNTPIKRPFLTVALLLFATIALPSRALAAFVFTLSEVGSDVLVSGSGTLDLTALTIGSSSTRQAVMLPAFGYLASGSTSLALDFSGVSGPVNFGSGLSNAATITSGDIVAIYGIDEDRIFVPVGYAFGTPLSNNSTYANSTFSSLGLVPGQYVYTWGTGSSADSLTVIIVPEPSTWALLTFVGGAFLGCKRLLGRRRAGFFR